MFSNKVTSLHFQNILNNLRLLFTDLFSHGGSISITSNLPPSAWEAAWLENSQGAFV